jgi:hypothetical protein
VVFAFKREFVKEIEHPSRNLQGLRHHHLRLLGRRGVSRRHFGSCCSGRAINSKGAPASAGCSGVGSNKCTRKVKKNPRSLLKVDSLPDFFQIEFTVVLSSYTEYNPVETRGIIDAKNTEDVAVCAVNRYIQNNFDLSFSCNVYFDHDCADNEDIQIKEGSGCEPIQSSGAPTELRTARPIDWESEVTLSCVLLFLRTDKLTLLSIPLKAPLQCPH